MIQYDITKYLQPTNHSCGQTAFAMLLSHYGDVVTPDDVIEQVEVNKDENGQELGTINQMLATYLLRKGHGVTLYSSDFQLLDPTWASLTDEELIGKLEAVKATRQIPALGDHWTQAYLQSYIDFIAAGGRLEIVQYMSEQLFDSLLENGPFLPAVSTAVLYGDPHFRMAEGVRQLIEDDINGQTGTHSIVVYGKNDLGQYLVADPWKGETTVDAAALVAAVTAAQVECDSLMVAMLAE